MASLFAADSTPEHQRISYMSASEGPWDPLPQPPSGSYGIMDPKEGYGSGKFKDNNTRSIVPVLPTPGILTVRYLYHTTLLLRSLLTTLRQFVTQNVMTRGQAQNILTAVCKYLKQGCLTSSALEATTPAQEVTPKIYLPKVTVYGALTSFRHKTGTWQFYVSDVILAVEHPMTNAGVLGEYNVRSLQEHADTVRRQNQAPGKVIVIKTQEGLRYVVLPAKRILKIIMLAKSNLDVRTFAPS